MFLANPVLSKKKKSHFYCLFYSCLTSNVRRRNSKNNYSEDFCLRGQWVVKSFYMSCNNWKGVFTFHKHLWRKSIFHYKIFRKDESLWNWCKITHSPIAIKVRKIEPMRRQKQNTWRRELTEMWTMWRSVLKRKTKCFNSFKNGSQSELGRRLLKVLLRNVRSLPGLPGNTEGYSLGLLFLTSAEQEAGTESAEEAGMKGARIATPKELSTPPGKSGIWETVPFSSLLCAFFCFMQVISYPSLFLSYYHFKKLHHIWTVEFSPMTLSVHFGNHRFQNYTMTAQSQLIS